MSSECCIHPCHEEISVMYSVIGKSLSLTWTNHNTPPCQKTSVLYTNSYYKMLTSQKWCIHPCLEFAEAFVITNASANIDKISTQHIWDQYCIQLYISLYRISARIQNNSCFLVIVWSKTFIILKNAIPIC